MAAAGQGKAPPPRPVSSPSHVNQGASPPPEADWLKRRKLSYGRGARGGARRAAGG